MSEVDCEENAVAMGSLRNPKSVEPSRMLVPSLFNSEPPCIKRASGGCEATIGSPSPRRQQAPQERLSAEQREIAIERVACVAAQHREELRLRLSRLRARSYASDPLQKPCQSGASTKGKSNASENAVIIFDWDDTLFPTWFVVNVVFLCGEKYRQIEADSPFFGMLQEHACLVKQVLTLSSAIARVAIITNALSPWVETSSAMYLPGLDLGMVLKELNIRVYYARDTMRRDFRCQAIIEASDDVNPLTVAKRCAMLKCLRHLYRGNRTAKWNVMCVGDSIFEHEAIKDVLWCSETAGEVPWCKTIKFMEDPNVQQLMDQLHVVAASAEKVINHNGDLDLSMEDWESSELQKYSGMEQTRADLDLQQLRERVALSSFDRSRAS
jgi:hypothetical protein